MLPEKQRFAISSLISSLKIDLFKIATVNTSSNESETMEHVSTRMDWLLPVMSMPMEMSYSLESNTTEGKIMVQKIKCKDHPPNDLMICELLICEWNRNSLQQLLYNHISLHTTHWHTSQVPTFQLAQSAANMKRGSWCTMKLQIYLCSNENTMLHMPGYQRFPNAFRHVNFLHF